MTQPHHPAPAAPTTGSLWVVTGAAGTVGTALRAALQEQGVDLVSTDLREPTSLGDRDRVVAADVADLEGLVELVAGADGVVHLGAIADEADFHDLATVNIVGTYHVLEAARRAGVPRVVFASTNRVTGMHPAGMTTDPTMPTRPDGFYGASKVAGEALCQLYADKFGLSTIAVRIGSYGDEPGSAREQRTWLSRGDAVRAFVAAMTTDAHHAVFYAVSANRDRWWDLEAGRAVGFEPQDDASTRRADEPYDPAAPQGGPYAEVAFSLDRMTR